MKLVSNMAKSKMRSPPAFTLLLAVACSKESAPMDALRVPSFISSDMVLQRGHATLWGWAAPNASVSISVSSARGGQLHLSHAVASASGAWSADIVQKEAAASTSVIIRDDTSKIALVNVAFGDVFLCSG